LHEFFDDDILDPNVHRVDHQVVQDPDVWALNQVSEEDKSQWFLEWAKLRYPGFNHRKIFAMFNEWLSNPDTIADGLRTSLGTLTYPIINKLVNDILTVNDHSITEAMKLVWERMKIIIEPSSAVALAVVLKHKHRFAGQKIGIIISGGNVDLMHLPWM